MPKQCNVTHVMLEVNAPDAGAMEQKSIMLAAPVPVCFVLTENFLWVDKMRHVRCVNSAHLDNTKLRPVSKGNQALWVSMSRVQCAKAALIVKADIMRVFCVLSVAIAHQTLPYPACAMPIPVPCIVLRLD